MALQKLKRLKILKLVAKNQSADLSDFEQLSERFKGYQAPAINHPYYIQSGIERILPKNYETSLNTEQSFIALNRTMEQNAINRQKTKELWDNGVCLSYDAPRKEIRDGVLSTIKVPDFFYTNGYLRQLLNWGLLWSMLAIGLIRPHGNVHSVIDMIPYIFLFCLIGFCISIAKPTYKYLRCSSPEKIIRLIGVVFLETLVKIGKIQTDVKNVSLYSKMDSSDGSVFFSAPNLSLEENSLLINCMLEFINPIENPRYLFVRMDKVANFIDTTDYHAIPSIVSANKNNVAIFQSLWLKHIGKCEVIFTRNFAGRRRLLYARKNSYSDLARSKNAKRLSRFE